jgi:hypothetical protein
MIPYICSVRIVFPTLASPPSQFATMVGPDPMQPKMQQKNPCGRHRGKSVFERIFSCEVPESVSAEATVPV